MAVTDIRAQDECINSLLGDTCELLQSRGRKPGRHPQPTFLECVSDLKTAFQAKGRANSPSSQKDWGVCFSPQPEYPGGGNLPRIISSTTTVPWDSGTQAPWPREPGSLGAYTLGGDCKIRDSRHRNQGAGCTQSSPAGDTGLWSTAEDECKDNVTLPGLRKG